MAHDYTLYTLALSMYAGKTRGYMNYKKLNYIDKKINFYDISVTIPRHTGERVMPVLKTKDGEWFQDTTIIAEELERRHPEPTIATTTPVQTLAALLLEAWGDEYWLPIAMHYRWSYEDENVPFFLDYLSKAFFPGLPAFLGRSIARLPTKRLAAAGPAIGFIPEQHLTLEDWTKGTLDDLEAHFAIHDYLFGGRPTVADFSLLASFFGHLNYDPAPKRLLMASRPYLTAWVERMKAGTPGSGPLVADDAIPDTLMPILQRVFTEFLPMIKAYRDVVTAYVANKGARSGDAIPRFMDTAAFPMEGRPFRRKTMPYSLWMMQWVRKKLLEWPAEDQQKAEAWMQSMSGTRLAELDLGPELVRTGLSTALA